MILRLKWVDQFLSLKLLSVISIKLISNHYHEKFLDAVSDLNLVYTVVAIGLDRNRLTISQQNKIETPFTLTTFRKKKQNQTFIFWTFWSFIVLADPKFSGPIQNATVAVGRDAVLTCMVEDLGAYKVSFCVNCLLNINCFSTVYKFG